MEGVPSGEPLGTENDNCDSTRFSSTKRNFEKNRVSYAYLTFKDVGGPFKTARTTIFVFLNRRLQISEVHTVLVLLKYSTHGTRSKSILIFLFTEKTYLLPEDHITLCSYFCFASSDKE